MALDSSLLAMLAAGGLVVVIAKASSKILRLSPATFVAVVSSENISLLVRREQE